MGKVHITQLVRFLSSAGGVVLLAGCAGLAGDGSVSSPTETAERGGIEDYYEQDLTWGPCDEEWLLEPESLATGFVEAEVTCASVLVPAVYDDSSGNIPDFEIAMMRRSPTSDAFGTIFINPGGPGVSGIEQVQYSDFPPELGENFHIIGFDPRGVDHSRFADGSEIRCSDVLDFLTYFEEGSPANEAELDEVVVALDRHYETCSRENPYWWTLSTDNVAKDLDIMREAVTPGDPLNFIGSSYGTTIAGRYVSYFPDHVGKIVFDSPTTVDEDRIEANLEGLAADEEKLRGFVEGYADNQELSFEQAWQVVMDVRQLADDDRLYGYAGIEPSPEFPNSQISSESLFRRGILALNYFPEDFAQEVFNQAIYEAKEFQWNGPFEYYGFLIDGYDPDSLEGASLDEKNIIRSNEFEIRVIVNTMDYSPPPLSEQEQRELSARSAEVAPLLTELYSDPSGYEYFGPPKGLDWYQLAIADPAIPDPPDTPFIPSNPSGKNVLIVGSTKESVTPFSFAEDTAELLGGTLITVESAIHAPAAGYDNDCVNRILLDYFLDRAEIVAVTCPG